MAPDVSVPVVVAGAGACGAVAALAARAAGADVLVLEQDATAFGTTSMSQGLICAAGTSGQHAAGVADSPDAFFADIMAKTRGLTDPVLARAIAAQAGPALDWLIADHGLPYGLDVRFRAAYGHSVARVHGWLGHGGQDLLGFLHQRLAASGVDVLHRARLSEVRRGANGGVASLVVARPDGAAEHIGCGALVLATGGFGANASMVAEHMPEVSGGVYNGHEGSQGDGLRLGAALGGHLADMAAYQGYGMLTTPQGVTVPPGVLVEGGILVNQAGERFVNEVEDISGLVLPVLAQPEGAVWVVYDARIEAACAYIPESQTLIGLGAARQGEGARLLAERMGVPAEALAATLGAAGSAAASFRPDALGRVWTGAAPPSGDLRALRVRGALYHTQGGLQVDGTARVMRRDGTRVPGLFAGGGAARGVSGPSCWGYLPAMGLCAAVTLGRLAGQNAAAAV